MTGPIAVLLHADERGGAERTVRVLAGTLARRGLDVDLVLMTGGEPRPGTAPPGVRLVRLGARRVATSVYPLARYLARERPAVVLSALTHANVAALVAGRLSRRPVRVVLSEHTEVSRLKVAPHRRRDRFQPWFAARLYRHADAIICVSRGLAEDLASLTGLPPARFEVIPNPVPLDNVVEALDAPPPHPWLADGGPPVVVAVGRLERVKDFGSLIGAVARLRDKVPARLIIVGEGRERGRLEATARKHGIDDHVLLAGFQENPYPWMARASVVALSSVREALAIVLVEALALSRPVVSTDCRSGPSEVLMDGRLGRLVTPGDGGALANALLEALEEGPRPVPYEVLARYDPERVADSYLAVLMPDRSPVAAATH